ncbi:MAG: hypothetical protein OWU33_04640 [Firmicutes bacterium]|nr:hypothetical protein [Bacillota bacterium]
MKAKVKVYARFQGADQAALIPVELDGHDWCLVELIHSDGGSRG